MTGDIVALRQFIEEDFDARWYLNNNKDVAEAGIDPLTHWLEHGINEFRIPGPNLLFKLGQQRSLSPPWRRFMVNGQSIWLCKFKLQENVSSAGIFPPGHFYSAIVDPRQLLENGHYRRHKSSELYGIELRFDRMISLFVELQAYFSGYRYGSRSCKEYRYFNHNDFFEDGDALVLWSIISLYKPKRVIEVGSGFSTAVILDALEAVECFGHTQVTCIDPSLERLSSVIRETDRQFVAIRSELVQDTDLKVFTQLDAGDILFLDTSHICKTGSDVCYELFRVLPILRSGVIIHFHDVFFGFEYPEEWVLRQNRSWNEQYLLRAFLMHNKQYDIMLINDFVVPEFTGLIDIDPRFLSNPGGSLWLRKR